ncbi:50S ribosomal protein L4 [Iodidimonas sp. SYSU 1G8]|uniref:50S ribosomal protein L4 n=1 Tax=Iodidimonas sp. SYSU 1G8 TaxID=3133967 RepID=UPI0031FED1F0
MKVDVITLEAGNAGSVDLSDAIFSLPARQDLLQRTVRWQLAKRQAGTHKTKGRSEIALTGKKFVKQKGSGGARHGDRKAPQFRGGGKAFGPVVRSHEHDLPKKVRKLALKTALSVKQAEGNLVVLDQASLADPKTKGLVGILAKLGWSNALIIDGDAVEQNFARAAANIPHIDVLPSQGANVYDILRHNTLVLTKAGLERLEERLK